MSRTDVVKYSIIIPHHNIPELLERCLKSIPVRDDVQTLVVDDLSDPQYQEPLHELEKKYPSVTFIFSQTNGGAGRARNIGMEHAVGHYLVFADADDFFSEEFDTILSDYSTQDYDVVYFRNISVLSDSISTKDGRTSFIDEIFDRYEKCGDASEIRCKIFNPWAKFFRKGLADEKHIRFDEIPCANDLFFVVSMGCEAENIKVDKRVAYVYTDRPTSITASVSRKPASLGIRADACFRAQKVMKEHGFYFNFMPMSEFLSAMFHSDKQLFKKYLLKSKEAYRSRWEAIRQVRGWEVGVASKLWICIYSFSCILFK